jgi:hypothetical protein
LTERLDTFQDLLIYHATRRTLSQSQKSCSSLLIIQFDLFLFLAGP